MHLSEQFKMTNLTPSKYWRVACTITAVSDLQSNFSMPTELTVHTRPPRPGDGVIVAAYDDVEEVGLVCLVGVIGNASAGSVAIDWRGSNAQIWVDTPSGRNFWKRGHFAFAPAKIEDYGLHVLFRDHFEDMELRETSRTAGVPRVRRSNLNGPVRERLEPLEVVGEPSTAPRTGVVYVLKSAYGYKVGRTRSVPTRMRTFAVRLPFFYTIPLCVWFEDCEEAERRYHAKFREQRINGEWFNLSEVDIEQIRART